jgi:quercetin dioxygenase-like cupin family protein
MQLNKINEDDRGSIHAITGALLNIPEVAIMKTKAGLARGGCIHYKSHEYLCVLEGKITYHYHLQGLPFEYVREMKAGDIICIPPNTPHYMVSDTDSIIAEWGPTPEEKQVKHEQMRRLVLEHNKTV